MPAAGLFILIGAEPFTAWLPAAVSRDRWGFILTGPDTGRQWPLGRAPFLLETTTPGVFAAASVRTGICSGDDPQPPSCRIPIRDPERAHGPRSAT